MRCKKLQDCHELQKLRWAQIQTNQAQNMQNQPKWKRDGKLVMRVKQLFPVSSGPKHTTGKTFEDDFLS